MEWITNEISDVDSLYYEKALQRQNTLTKPLGSLGQLENIAVRLAGMQKTLTPSLDNINIVIFAADHGVAEEGVSAFPQAVTVEMIRNFARGGAAISVLSKQLDAELSVVNVGTVTDHESLDHVLIKRIADGTENLSRQAAMTTAQLSEALSIGKDSVDRAIKMGAQMFVGGEMGIANTTSAAAIACAVLNESAETLVGPGTGLNLEGIKHKTTVVNKALTLHHSNLKDPVSILCHLGGFEIAALTGAYLSCAQRQLPVLVDGYIASVAALLAFKIKADVKHWFFYGHQSAEPGHQHVLQALQAKPLLNIGMRLGEGSGAAVAIPMMRLACALHHQMATFGEAGVSEKT